MNQVIKHLNVAIDFDEDANEVTIDATQPLGSKQTMSTLVKCVLLSL